MPMISDGERREVARRLRELDDSELQVYDMTYFAIQHAVGGGGDWYPDGRELADRLADLIEPSYKPDAEYETWYNGLSHFGDERGGPSTIHELIEEIVWTALTVDLGPNGNTDSTGVDEGRVYTDRLFAEWEREALRLSGGIDRDALLALADEFDAQGDDIARVIEDSDEDFDRHAIDAMEERYGYARRIREAYGVES